MKKSLISAIKKLLAKLGAEEVEGNNLVEVIDNGADAIEGGGGSGGGGIVTLYFTYDNSTDKFNEAYKDIAMTEGFSSTEEAMAVLGAATVVKLCYVAESIIDSIFIAIAFLATSETVSCVCCGATGDAFIINVAINSNEDPGPAPLHPVNPGK